MERQENDMVAVISTAEAPYQASLKGMLRKLGDMAMPLKVGFFIGLAFAVIGLMMECLFGPFL